MSEHDVPIEQLLDEAEALVARMSASPGARELKERLARCRREWAASPPSEERRQALREQIDEVVRIARVTSPTVRSRRRPPTG